MSSDGMVRVQNDKISQGLLKVMIGEILSNSTVQFNLTHKEQQS